MKDYKKLQEKINTDKQITSKDITELGYSHYDINLFIEAGILKRSKRGLYEYLPEIEVSNLPIEEPVEQEIEQTFSVLTTDIPKEQKDPFYYISDGINKILKRETNDSINSFKQALKIEPTNSHAKIGLVGAYVFLEDYENAYAALVDFYKTRSDNSLLYNVYYYLLLLSKHTNVDMKLLNEVKEEINNNRHSLKKLNTNFKRMHSALNEEDYLEALKFINFSIAMDKKSKKYYITSHIHKALIMATLRLKGIDPYEEIIKAKEQASRANIEENLVEDKVPVDKSEKTVVEETPIPVESEPEVIVVPQVTESIVKVNVLLEAINNNDYELALNLLEKENIEEPVEVIRILLSKLSTIKSLITSTTPVKVIATEPVRVVEEDSLVDDIIEVPEREATLTVEETVVEETVSVVDSTVEVPKEKEPSKEELANIAYKAYKNSYHSEQFDEAVKNLRRYEYINNSKGTPRNINYHYIRIEQSRKDFAENPERYIKKKALAKVIFDLKRNRRYDAALAAIEEYKSLGGLRNELIVLVEAEIYFYLGNIEQTKKLLNSIRSSEEPTFFTLSSKVSFNNYRFEEALKHCQAYNERRPSTTPANYQLMGDCYSRLGKPGKAIKAYRKAEEIAGEKGYRPLDLSGKINQQEMRSETKKEERTARYLEKKK